MKYVSTRGKSAAVTASKAIMDGLAPDGGLYIPDTIPELCSEDFEKLLKLDYNGRAKHILSMYLDDFSKEEIDACVDRAYTAQKFEGSEIVPLYSLDNKQHLLELWHGPTCAFKDLALQILPHLLTTSIKKQGERRTVVILVATSGDTGKAALEGFCDVAGCKIMVFYPTGGVSNIQKLQMTTQQGGNVCSCGIEGNFDDAQTGVKKIFSDEKIKDALDQKGYFLSSANSINWGRLAPQIVYYIDAYLKLVSRGGTKLGEKVNIVVPTGNFGNILAAYFAYKMGLPVNKFICASNANNVLTDFINTGVYDRRRKFYSTISPSMDILISSNLERMLYLACGKDSTQVDEFMRSLKESGTYTVPESVKAVFEENYVGLFCDDTQTKQEIKSVFDACGYVSDTHTAVALNAFRRYAESTGDTTPALIASTASPYKFAESVLNALGRNGNLNEFAQLEELEDLSKTVCPVQLASLKDKPVRFKGVCDKDDMAQQLFDFLK